MARTQGSHSDITGPKVREAALRLFARHGFAAVSMRQIATEVGVQAGALYNYTSDKQSLLFDLLKAHMDGLLAGWKQEAVRLEASDPRAALEAFTRFHIRFNTQRADAVFISYMELRNLSPENFEAIGALRRTYESSLEDILAQGARLGVFSVQEPRITAMALIAMLTGVNTWFREQGRLSLPEVETLYWNMVRQTVGA
ncbi:TetR/AcrR family transcriptional regulator [Roseovarius rhodophyticola]|uniref:TetR/AcrR family transcriptional regulator n=1 Tax=Roseovarius rhodophyticola TaxID=3080827 RepID=A0ABZ2TC63_9RHOB|nr:TetR/AcrR family transcriptional regulator [Roseovarius sp. W115]MDV2931040.1 TetR/AcrR family transcriptional regulator [Roseovarius sp. W115]